MPKITTPQPGVGSDATVALIPITLLCSAAERSRLPHSGNLLPSLRRLLCLVKKLSQRVLFFREGSV